MITHRVTLQYDNGGGITVQKALSYQANGQVDFEGTFADSGGYKEIDVAFLKNNVKALLIMSDQPVTLKTNANDNTADDTFSLAANVPIIWTQDYPKPVPLAADVAKLWVTNASGAIATLRVAVLVDVTP